MTKLEQKEIDRLLSDLTDGNREQAAAELESLLIDRPDLQAYYARAVTVHSLLSLEFQQAEGKRAPAGLMTVSSYLDQHGPKFGALRSVVEVLSSAPWSTTQRWGVSLAAVACAILVAIFPLLSQDDSGDSNSRLSVSRLWSPRVDQNNSDLALVVHDEESIRLVSRLTKDPQVINLIFPRAEGASPQELTLCSGSAWIDRLTRSREHGYLLALPAGCRMEVDIDTDASSRNSLAVVEISPSGRATGETLLFDNSVSKFSDTEEVRAGYVGSFSEFNDSPKTKFYLLTGSYLLHGASEDDEWHQSDYRIQLDSEDVLVIGWDDSAYRGSEKENPEDASDRDFNDIHAVFRFSFPDGRRDSMIARSQYIPEPIQTAPQEQVETGSGYVFDLKPGEMASISVASYARWQNSFTLVDVGTKQVIWRNDGVPFKDAAYQPSDMGAYVLRNFEDKVKRYEIQGRHKTHGSTDADPWFVSPFQVLEDSGGALIVGFEDNPDQAQYVDWQDVRVYLRIYSP